MSVRRRGPYLGPVWSGAATTPPSSSSVGGVEVAGVAADRDRGRPSGQRTPSHRPGAEWRGRARRWAWLAVLLIGVALYELCRRAVLATRDPLLLPTLILIGAAVVPVSFVVFVSGRRLVFGVGGAVVGLTALLGGVLAVLTAGTLEYATLRALGAPSLLAVGLIEELAKLLVPAAVLLLSRGVRHPADGLLLGVAAGAGFAVAETMGYAFVALVRSGGDLSVVNTVLVDRGVLSPAAHMAWTGLAAAALWRAASVAWRGRAVAGFVGVYLLVAAVHTAWDAAGDGWMRGVLALVSLGLLTWTADRLAASDRRALPAGAQSPAVAGGAGNGGAPGSATG